MYWALTLLFLICPVRGDVHFRWKRVVGGRNATAPGNTCSWPYIVRVERTCTDWDHSNPHVPFRCSGSIMDADHVLTARQCVVNDPASGCHHVTLRVTAGMWEWDAPAEGTRQEVMVQVATPHPVSGVAVLTLATPLSLSSNFVWPIDLTGVDPPTNTECHASGWGRVNWAAGAPLYANHLQEVDLVVRINPDIHKPELLKLSTGTPGLNESSGVYEGDSGGPVVRYRGPNCSYPEQVAVINCPRGAGSSCGDGRVGNHPSAAYYMYWIYKQIDPEYGENSAASSSDFLTVYYLQLLIYFYIYTHFK